MWLSKEMSSINKLNEIDEPNIVKSINEFSFHLYSGALANVNANMAIAPITLYNILNLLGSCASESTHLTIKNAIAPSQSTNDPPPISILLDNSAKTQSKWNLCTKERFLKPNYVKTLEKNEPKLKIDQDSNTLEKRLDQLNVKIKNEKLALVLDSALELNLEWETQFEPVKEKGIFFGPSRKTFEISLMKIPKQK